MLIGWLMVSTIMILLHQSSDLSMEYDVTSGSAQPPPGAPSVELLSLAFFGFGVGMWMADVMGDSIMAEKARLEPEERRGQMQSTCYASRFFGIMIAAPVSTYLYSEYGPGPIVFLLACAPLPILPLLYLFSENRTDHVQSTKQQFDLEYGLPSVCLAAPWLYFSL
jgi:MFS family permease